MKRNRGVGVLVALLAVGLALVGASAARAASLTCGVVITTSGTYTLDRDLSCQGTAISALGIRGVTIDLGGHTISGDGTGVGVLLGGDAIQGQTPPVNVVNGTIRHFADGVKLVGELGGTLSRLSLFHNGAGLFFDSENQNYNVTNNLIAGNGVGIAVGSFDTGLLIEHNLVTNNVSGGIAFGTASDSHVIRNTITNNGGDGLSFFASPSDVTGNVVSGNKANGIWMSDSLPVQLLSYVVTNNTANDNGQLGITAVFPVTDGGGNIARHNGDPRQCVNVSCAPF